MVLPTTGAMNNARYLYYITELNYRSRPIAHHGALLFLLAYARVAGLLSLALSVCLVKYVLLFQ